MENIKKTFKKDLFVLWFALASLVVAGLSLNTSLNLLVEKEGSEET